jgi:hydrogenase maturation factor
VATLPPGKLAPGLLEELLASAPTDASVVLGPAPGRDVAVVDAGGARYLLLTADPVTFATDEIGLYLVTVNANDIATAGGTPRWLLATLLFPARQATAELVRGVQAQLEAACRQLGVALVGGHTEVTVGIDRPIVVGAMVGDVSRERLVRSDGGRPEDVVLLTQAAALEGSCILAREHREPLRAAGFESRLLDRCAGLLRTPGLGVLPAAHAALRATLVHAMHDPTEGGVATALWEIAEASRLSLRVEPHRIPVLPETRRLCDHFGLDPLGLIASGALLLLVDPVDAEAVIRACEEEGIPCTRIGHAEAPGAQGSGLFDAASGRPLPRFPQDELTRV